MSLTGEFSECGSLKRTPSQNPKPQPEGPKDHRILISATAAPSLPKADRDLAFGLPRLGTLLQNFYAEAPTCTTCLRHTV